MLVSIALKMLRRLVNRFLNQVDLAAFNLMSHGRIAR